MSSDNTSDRLSLLAACTADVRQWYLQNGLQLNPDKSEALVIGTANQPLTTNSAITSVCVADDELSVANEIKVLGVVLDRRLQAFDNHVLAVTLSCTSHLPYTAPIVNRSGTQTGLQSDPDETGQLQLGTLRRANQQHPEVAARIVLQATRLSHAKTLMRQLYWLPVQHRIDYKVSVLTYKTLNTSVLGYHSQRINRSVNARTLYAQRLRHCSSNHSLAPTSRNVLFDAPQNVFHKE